MGDAEGRFATATLRGLMMEGVVWTPASREQWTSAQGRHVRLNKGTMFSMPGAFTPPS